MLQTLMKKRTPIKITEGYVKANARRTSRSNTFYLYGFIPIATIKTDSSEVNIPFTHIANFNNPNLSSHMRIYNLQVFIHEFGHAFIGIKNPKDTNSIEEELGVSMVGYNIAHKVITGKYLDKSQTETYSNNALEGLLLDEHRDLPVFSGFNDSIQKFGIALPYPEVYTNIPLMYKTLLMENKVKPAPTFYPYVKGRIAS